MKILAVRTKNLASLDGLNEINFTTEPLSTAGIFAITGPTGSGKSTILDALCLALYAKTPRYAAAGAGVDVVDVKGTTIPQHDPRRVLRMGAGDGFAEVDFVSIDGEAYRSKWSVRRAHGKADGALQAYEMSLTKITENQPVSGRKTELLDKITHLVGLSFEQFTRSVLLAQGDFTAFLKAGKDEKASLLEKLTGTYIYSDISKQVFENHKAERVKLDVLNTSREGIYTFTEEELNEKEIQLEDCGEELVEAKKEEEILTKERTWHIQLAEFVKMAQETERKYKSAIEQKTNAFPREKKLREVIQIQPAKSLVDDVKRMNKNFLEKSELADELAHNLQQLLQLQKDVTDKKESLIGELKKKKQAENDAKPLLDKAKSLDVQLEEKQKQKDLAETQKEKTLAEYENLCKQLSDEETKLDAINTTIEEITCWLQKNEARKLLGEEKDSVLRELSYAGKFLIASNVNEKNIATTEKELRKLGIHESELRKKAENLNETITKQKAELLSQRAQVNEINIQDLELQKQDADRLNEEIILAEAHWKNLFSSTNAFHQLLKDYQTDKDRLQKTQDELSAANQLLSAKKVEKETSQKMLEKARLAATDNVENLRQQLISSEPCPVCGSTKHPYIIENPELSNVLKSLEKEYNEAENIYENQFSLFKSLEAQLETLESSTANFAELIPIKEKELADIKREWEQLDIHKQAENVDMDMRANWLERKKFAHKKHQTMLQEQISLYYSQKEALENTQDQFQKSLNELGEISLDIKTVEGLISTEKIKLERYRDEKNNAQAGLQKSKETLSIYFPYEIWYENWLKNPEEFERELSQFAEMWKGKSESLIKNRQFAGIAEATVKELRKQSESLKKDVADKNDSFEKIIADWSQVSEQRKAIFGGKSVWEVESELKMAVETAEATLKDCEVEAANGEKNVTQTSTRLQQTEIDRENFEKSTIESKTKLTDWISEYNARCNAKLSEKLLSELLRFDQNWIEHERAELQKLTDDVNLTKSAFEERQKDVNHHIGMRISEKELPEVEALLTKTQTEITELQEKINGIRSEIKENERKHEQIAVLLQHIEKQHTITDDWAKLNELIGSADGKKFRQIAQEYTLDVLLSYANVHLASLNPRYVLERTATSLGLQIKDLNMGNEVRTVYSLSGGESFLVSLALALGLASLSSNRIQVETLFIDEGFGSLDIETLNIAMDALERLHNQGRKVGVISHVQEMSERISTQIHVSKQRSGKSVVKVRSI